MAAVRNIAEYVSRTVDEDHHSMDARLPDGSRVHVIIAPAAGKGPRLHPQVSEVVVRSRFAGGARAA